MDQISVRRKPMFRSAHDVVKNPYYIVSIALSAFMLAAPLENAYATAAPSQTCKASAGGHGIAESRSIAKIKAKDHWSKRMETVYGAEWASFSNAQETSFKCQQSATLWGCAVNAKPCKEQPDLAQSDSAGEMKTVSQTARQTR
jgi:hypothetical protein